MTIKNLLKLRKRLVKYKTGMTVAAKELKGFAPKATSMDVVGSISARKNDKELKAYFDRRIADGKLKYKVYNAIRNKFVHRIFAVVKRSTPYTELAQHKS